MGAFSQTPRWSNAQEPFDRAAGAAVGELAAGDYLVALEPTEAFARRIVEARALVGELLDRPAEAPDAPLLTLYEASFPCRRRLEGLLAEVATVTAAPWVRADGWRVFEADEMTGDVTVVCEMVATDRPILQNLQLRVVQALGDHRDPEATRLRYDDVAEQLSDIERTNLLAAGFPYVGSLWRPHVTVASVRLDDWPIVWPALADEAPTGLVQFDALTLYEYDDQRAVPVGRFPLG